MTVLLPRASYRRMRWKNDAGWTSEIAVHPASGEFDWRVSIAEIEADSGFSSFPQIDRSILVLDGAGMTLVLDETVSVELTASGSPLAFAGEQAVHARLLDGPTRDFNVMTRRGAVEHELSRCELGEPVLLDCPAGRGWLVHVVTGHAEVDALVAAEGDSVLIEPDVDGRAPLVVHGLATLVLVRLDTKTK